MIIDIAFPFASVPLWRSRSGSISWKMAQGNFLRLEISYNTQPEILECQLLCYRSSSTVEVCCEGTEYIHESALKLLHKIPKRYAVIFIACDTYACISTKSTAPFLRR